MFTGPRRKVAASRPLSISAALNLSVGVRFNKIDKVSIVCLSLSEPAPVATN